MVRRNRTFSPYQTMPTLEWWRLKKIRNLGQFLGVSPKLFAKFTSLWAVLKPLVALSIAGNIRYGWRKIRHRKNFSAQRQFLCDFHTDFYPIISASSFLGSPAVVKQSRLSSCFSFWRRLRANTRRLNNKFLNRTQYLKARKLSLVNPARCPMVPTLTGPVLESAIILMIDRAPSGHNETPKLLRISTLGSLFRNCVGKTIGSYWNSLKILDQISIEFDTLMLIWTCNFSDCGATLQLYDVVTAD